MIRRDISLTVALCASLTAHAVMLGGAAELYTVETGRHIRIPGFSQQAVATALLIEQPEDDDPMHRLGDSTGGGTAISASPGDLPLLAQQASQDQPFLSLDPAGPGRIGDDPTDSMLPLGRPGAAAQLTAPAGALAAADSASAPPAQASKPFGFGSPPSELTTPFAPAQPVEQPQAVAQAQAQAQAQSQANAAVQAIAQAQGADAVAGADSAADPAPQGNTESDPTSTIGSAEFRPGSTDVRLGRKFKLTRPHLSVAGQMDLVTLPSPTVVLKLVIDESGNVTAAEIFRSSGSTSVDQPCKLAAFNWWFEPSKDRNGNPVRDVILFTIRFI